MTLLYEIVIQAVSVDIDTSVPVSTIAGFSPSRCPSHILPEFSLDWSTRKRYTAYTLIYDTKHISESFYEEVISCGAGSPIRKAD